MRSWWNGILTLHSELWEKDIKYAKLLMEVYMGLRKYAIAIKSEGIFFAEGMMPLSVLIN
jgi:hypothetical protein